MLILLFIALNAQADPFIKNGKCKFNIGHRIGGDITGVDNNPKSADKVIHLQNHKCFKCWEFDVRSAKDGLIVFHNTQYRGKDVRYQKMRKVRGIPLDRFISDMNKKKITKPYCMDLKQVYRKHESALIKSTKRLSKVKFLLRGKLKNHYKNLIKKLGSIGYLFGYY